MQLPLFYIMRMKPVSPYPNGNGLVLSLKTTQLDPLGTPTQEVPQGTVCMEVDSFPSFLK
jgi:hypothetical protein